MNNYNFKVFVDCGAPSLYNKLSRNSESAAKGIMGTRMSERKFDDYSYVETQEYAEYRQSYIDFIKANQAKIDVYSNLDVINNPQLTYRNQKILEEGGINPIPVFHLGNDEKWLDRIIGKYEYMALGGLVPNPTSVLKPILDRIFKEHILDKSGYPKIKVHGFACTSLPLMKRYPWFSVDSATCRKLANFGSVVLPNYALENPIDTFQVSARPKRITDKEKGEFFPELPTSNWYDDMTPQKRKAFEKRCEKYDISFKQLGESIIHRVVWNYLIFSEVIQHTVPKWPWRMEDQKNWCDPKARKGAEDYMTFYFAGILSKSEEDAFWAGVNKEEVQKLKGTLRSFFYKKNAEYVLSLKK